MFHYYPIKGKKSLEKTQVNDKIKNKFCEIHEYNLIRIPYTLNKIIDKILVLILTEDIETVKKFIIESQGSTTIPSGGEIPH